MKLLQQYQNILKEKSVFSFAALAAKQVMQSFSVYLLYLNLFTPMHSPQCAVFEQILKQQYNILYFSSRCLVILLLSQFLSGIILQQLFPVCQQLMLLIQLLFYTIIILIPCKYFIILLIKNIKLCLSKHNLLSFDLRLY